MCQQSKASTIITMPNCSQTRIISGDGGLWEVLKALTPMDFIRVICRSSASALIAEPSAPWSWCRSTPWSLAWTPLTVRPSSGSTLT